MTRDRSVIFVGLPRFTTLTDTHGDSTAAAPRVTAPNPGSSRAPGSR